MGADVDTLPPGSRVVVRHRLSEPDAVGHTLTDVVGDLADVSPELVVVTTRTGEVSVLRSSIVTVKTVPPRASRRGAPHRALSVEALQEVMVGAWGALEREWLGRWQLRAGAGYTMRANSVALLGDPGMPLAEAVDHARDWYAVRSLPLNLTLAGPVGFSVTDDPLGQLVLGRGGREAERCLTMTADTAAVLAAVSPSTIPDTANTPRELRELECETRPDLTERWLLAHRGYRSAHRLGASGSVDKDWERIARAVLTGSPAQLFATVIGPDGEVVALGRGGLTPGWVGLGSVWVHPDHRRRGLAQTVTRSLLAEAHTRGARATHLQVLSHNAPARSLYESMGFQPHHDYVNVLL